MNDPAPVVRVGLDVGGTKIDAVAMAGTDVVARRRVATERGEAGVLSSVADAIAALRSAAPLPPPATVGIGVPGLTDGRVVRHAVNLDLTSFDLAANVERLLGVPVAVENDVKAAALGAHALFGGDGTLALLNLGTGTAAGIVQDGRLWRGDGGVAGEIGHVSIDPHGPVCPCGQRGCIEMFVGGAAIAARWGRPADIPARDVFDAADAGDERAVSLRADVVWGVAAAVRLLVLAIDPRRIVLAGGLTGLGDRLLGLVAEELRRSSLASPFLASLRLDERVALLPAASPAAAVGAALVGASAPLALSAPGG